MLFLNTTRMKKAVLNNLGFLQSLSLIRPSLKLQQLSQRARLLQIFENISIFPAMDCTSRWP